jgi:hypothetical protein
LRGNEAFLFVPCISSPGMSPASFVISFIINRQLCSPLSWEPDYQIGQMLGGNFRTPVCNQSFRSVGNNLFSNGVKRGWS